MEQNLLFIKRNYGKKSLSSAMHYNISTVSIIELEVTQPIGLMMKKIIFSFIVHSDLLT